MRLGADLAHVVCDPEAGSAIKTYSPDLIVHRVVKEEQTAEEVKEVLTGILTRMHAIVVGPGLGRDEYMFNAARAAIGIAKENKQYIVIDADGLFLVGKEPEIIKGYKRAVLTPNVIEFGRLCESMVSQVIQLADTLMAERAMSLLEHRPEGRPRLPR